MAKVSAISTLSPRALTVGAVVLAADALEVLEQGNWSFGERPIAHVSLGTGPDSLSSSTNHLLGMYLPTGSGWVERLHFRILIPADSQSHLVGCRVFLEAANTADVRVTIGSSSATAVDMVGGVSTGDFAASDNGIEKTCSIPTSSSGTGVQTVTLEINHTTGGGSVSYLRNFRCVEEVIAAADIPDPSDLDYYTDDADALYTSDSEEIYTT